MAHGDPAQPELDTLAYGTAYLSFCGRFLRCARLEQNSVAVDPALQNPTLFPRTEEWYRRVERGEVKVHISRFLLVRQSFSETEPRASSD